MINGERIKQAREFRGLIQTDLARLVGVNQSTIANVENGRFTPSQGLLAAISLGTGFPTSFFREEAVEDFPLGSLTLFRARASLTAHERVRAHAYSRTVYQCAAKLALRVTAIALRLPQLIEDPTTAANITRAAWGLSPDTPIRDLIYTIEKAGVLVLALPLVLKDVDAFSLWAGPDSRQPVIVVSAGKPGDRLRWSVAHEIGHLVLHQSMKGDVSGIEKEANRFAAELLVPEAAMRHELIPPITLTGLAELKPRWRVSIQALIMRALELHIVTDRQRTYLFQQLTRYGWRTREPTSLDVPVERPRALRQMAELLYGVPIDYRRMANEVRLSEQLVREIVEAHEGRARTPDSRVIAFPDTKGASSDDRQG